MIGLILQWLCSTLNAAIPSNFMLTLQPLLRLRTGIQAWGRLPYQQIWRFAVSSRHNLLFSPSSLVPKSAGFASLNVFNSFLLRLRELWAFRGCRQRCREGYWRTCWLGRTIRFLGCRTKHGFHRCWGSWEGYWPRCRLRCSRNTRRNTRCTVIVALHRHSIIGVATFEARNTWITFSLNELLSHWWSA